MFKTFRRTIRSLRKLHETTSLVRDTLVPTVDHIYEELDALRSKIDIDDELFDRYQTERKSALYQSVYEKDLPLVSICICTYNRGQLLIDRSLKSILEQDYEHFEVIVVGDCCTDNTAELISSLRDERIRFVNLPERGKYPEDPGWRWMVAGAPVLNHAFSLANGDFITQLDDDDEYAPERLNTLVRFIQKTCADMVWHPFWAQDMKGRWHLNKAEYYKKTLVTTSSIFFHNWFKQIPADVQAYKYLEAGDWNRLRKIKYLGAKMIRCPEPLVRHYKERTQITV